MSKDEEGISIRHLMTAPEWLKESPFYSGADTDGRLFDELKKGTLPEPLAGAVIDELRELAESSVRHSRKSRDSGRVSKRRWWADAVAQHLMNERSTATKEERWQLIPDSTNAVTISSQQGEIEFYQDTENGRPTLFASIHTADSDDQKTLSKRVFFDTYLRERPE